MVIKASGYTKSYALWSFQCFSPLILYILFVRPQKFCPHHFSPSKSDAKLNLHLGKIGACVLETWMPWCICFIYIWQNKVLTNHYLQSWTAAFGNSVTRKGLWHLEKKKKKFDWLAVSHVEEKQRDLSFILSIIRIFRQICLLNLFFTEVGTQSYYCKYTDSLISVGKQK